MHNVLNSSKKCNFCQAVLNFNCHVFLVFRIFCNWRTSWVKDVDGTPLRFIESGNSQFIVDKRLPKIAISKSEMISIFDL